MKECPKNKQGGGNLGNVPQYSSAAPPERDVPIGTTSGIDRGANYLYEIISRQEQENCLDVFTGMIKVFSFDVYDFQDRRASLSFVTSYVAIKFEILLEKLYELSCVSTLVGESILAERVYRDYPISINHKNPMDDLVELDMVDFNFILVMD